MNIDFDKTIESLKKYALSDTDIKNVLDDPTKIHNSLQIQENIYPTHDISDRLFRCIILISKCFDEISGLGLFIVAK